MKRHVHEEGINRELFSTLLLKPLTEQWKRIIYVFISLFVLSLSQSIILLLMGPFTTLLFQNEGEGSGLVAWVDLLPNNMQDFFSFFSSSLISHSDLCVVVPMLIVVAGVAKGAATYFYQISQQAVSLYLAKNYRDRLFFSIICQDFEKIVKRSPSQWMSNIMNDVQFLQTKFTDAVNGLVRDSITAVAAIIILFFVHWQTSLAVLSVSPIIAILMGKIGRQIGIYTEQYQKDLAEIASCVLNIRRRFLFIRSQHGEVKEKEKFEDFNESYYSSIRNSILLRSSFAPGLEFFGFLLLAVIIYLAGHGLLIDSMNASTMMTFFVAIGLLIKPLRNIGEQLSNFHETIGALRSSVDVFRSRINERKFIPVSKVQNANPTLTVPVLLKSIQMGFNQEVTMTIYDKKIIPGKSIAIIGSSGSGKSTFLKTLAGLIKPIEWNANITWEDFTSQSTFVSQDPFLFKESIRSNLLYGSPYEIRNNIESEIWQALDIVSLTDTVKSLPQGLDTSVASFATNFSGGQVQRLVIVRALLRKKTFLLFDEATSAVDLKSEEKIIKALIADAQVKRKCFIFSTHRLRLLDIFDEVWLFDHGKCILSGNHKENIKDRNYRSYYEHEVST
ncbi:MAG: ABC transporter ATP-binding protein [Bdellovibrionota bacterium]